MSMDTVPRPPVVSIRPDPTISENLNRRSPVDWRGVLILILTALPVAIAYVVGFTERCLRVLIAAVVEAYLSGRGIARE